MRVPVFTAFMIAILVCVSGGYIYGVQTSKLSKPQISDRTIICDDMANRSATRLQRTSDVTDRLYDEIVNTVYANCLVMGNSQ